ncbi:hypothetical protein FRC12_022931 [Ceratobasidium sp. 428]|nr:hypothetical protein FRC12_022931 [Ceratobasidium sp. 428]
MSLQSLNPTAKRFIAVEYEGRPMVVRRSANYDTTQHTTFQIILTPVKEAFRSLSSTEVERISTSACLARFATRTQKYQNLSGYASPIVEEDEDESEAEAEAEAEQNDDYSNDDSPEEDDDAENDEAVGTSCIASADVLPEDMPADQKPDAGLLAQPPTLVQDHQPIQIVHRREVKPRPSRSRTPIIPPDSLPDEPENWKGVDERNLIIASYFHVNRSRLVAVNILTEPETTIVDLQEYIALRSPFRDL